MSSFVVGASPITATQQMESSIGCFPVIVSSAVASLWEAVGLELLIFSMTVFFAHVLRNVGTVQTKSSKACKLPAEDAPLKQRPSAANSDFAASAPPQAAARRRISPGHDSELLRLARILDEIVVAVKQYPCVRTGAWALEKYSELCGELERLDVSIAQLARSSRWPASDMYSALISCAVRGKHSELVINLIQDMMRHGVPRQTSFYESTMKQLAGQKLYQLALDVYDLMAADGHKPSTVTCSCLINFAAEAGALDRAIDFFGMLQALTTPSIRAYMTILRVHCRRADWNASLATLQDMEQRGVGMDTLVLNVALATCVATENLDAAEGLLDRGHRASPPISDVVSCNSVIKGYAVRGDLGGALRLLKGMDLRGLRPNAITLNTAMDAAVRSNQLDEAWALLARMRSAGMSPDKFTCTILVKGVRKAMQADRCMAVLDVLEEASCGCDASLLNSLHHALLDTAAAMPDHDLVLRISSRMRARGIPVNDAAVRPQWDNISKSLRGRDRQAGV